MATSGGEASLARATALLALGQLSETRKSLELLRAGDQYFELFATLFLGRVKLVMGDGAAGMRDDYRSVLEMSDR